MSDHERVVVITGAASGIGYATAELFRDLGDIVYGLDIAPTVPDGVTYVECNVADRVSVEAAITPVRSTGGSTYSPTCRRRPVRPLRDDHRRRVGPGAHDRPQGPVHGDAGGAALAAGRQGQRSSTSRRSPAGCRGLHHRLLRGQGRAHHADPLAGPRVSPRASGSTRSARAPSTPRSSPRSRRLTADLDPRVADRLMMMLPGAASRRASSAPPSLPRLAGGPDHHRCRAGARRRDGLTHPGP